MNETGPDRIRAAIERDRGMGAPTAEEIYALGGACIAESHAAHAHVAMPAVSPPSRFVGATICPGCFGLRFGPAHLIRKLAWRVDCAGA